MEVKQGYKQTEVGVIPDDWEVTTVADQFSIQLGKMLDSEKNIGVLKPYLGNRAVQWGRIEINDISYIKLSASDLKRYRIEKGDLLVCEGGEIGRAAIWNELIEECYYQKALHRLRPISDYNVRFMLSVLEWLASSGLLEHFVTQTSIAHLPKERFEIVPIPLPPKAEQEAIAEALSDADALIESLEQLIAKKRQIKQGAMQELLTGKKRLSGFNGEWEESSLGDIGEISGAGVDKKIRLNEVPVRLLNYMDVYKKQCLRSAEFSHEVTAKPEQARRCSVQHGDVFFTPTSEVRDDIGHSAVAIEDMPDVVYSYHIVRFRIFASWDVLFRAYVFNAKEFFDQASMLCEGSGTRYVITLPKFRSIKIRYPVDFKEQAAIASVLSDMDAEIDALELKLEKARWIKQGMMHNLLTGKIRLV